MSPLPGHGVQIVTIDADDHTYKLDEEALSGILLEGEVRNCPVVVISVAGPFRGGKSFLLGFLLRYLSYTYCKVKDEGADDYDWLGNPDQPLEGFKWRAGFKPDTSGMLMWSKPIYVTRSDGVKVAVILMDSQGAFDTNSTMRDNSTIFALATLLSSALLYNLSKNIMENDLQYLQFFTQYGKMASRRGKQAFQKLMFLVRDWPYPYDIPYGAKGGAELLNRVLQTKSNQVDELKDVRNHLKSCFEEIECFLMPLPGPKVMTGQHFKGELKDIDELFLNSLRELVPSLLQPQNLIVKSICGRTVTGSDLFQYFKTYINSFNNKGLTCDSLLKATTKATILTALNAARRQYMSEMDSACDVSQPCMSEADLLELHQEVGRNAIKHVLDVIACVDMKKSESDPQLAELREELDKMFQNYKTQNTFKLEQLIKKAKNSYINSLIDFAKARDVESICLHPDHLYDLHRDALRNAVEVLDNNRRNSDTDNDVDKEKFIQELTAEFDKIKRSNEANNNENVRNAVKEYCAYMDEYCDADKSVPKTVLDLKHDMAHDEALEFFKNKRNRQSNHATDKYLDNLKEEIKTCFENMKKSNMKSGKNAVEAGVRTYNSYMERVCGPHLPCLHPDLLNQEHEEATLRALNEFRSYRMDGIDDDIEDDDLQSLRQEFQNRHRDLSNMNEKNNRAAVQAATSVCRTTMEAACGGGRPKLSSDRLGVVLESACDHARTFFKEKRNTGHSNSADTFDRELNEGLEELLTKYRAMNDRKPEEKKEAVAVRDSGGGFSHTLATGVANITYAVTRLLTGGLFRF